MPRTLRAERLSALWLAALAVAAVTLALMAAVPTRVSAHELLGEARDPGDRAFIASHRGGAALAPENTLPAVEAALSGGFDYVEVDVSLTADGHPVLFHDATVDRTTDGSGALAELTLAEVQRLDAGASHDDSFRGTRVPTAEQFLDLLARRDGRALLDLKGEWDAAGAAALVAAIENHGLERAVAVASFDARVLGLFGAASDVIARLVLLKQLPADVVEAAVQVGARGIIVDRKALLARPEAVDALQAAGMRVIVFTLNSDDQWGEVTALGVDGIVTDDPVRLDSWQQTLAAE